VERVAVRGRDADTEAGIVIGYRYVRMPLCTQKKAKMMSVIGQRQ